MEIIGEVILLVFNTAIAALVVWLFIDALLIITGEAITIATESLRKVKEMKK